VNTILKVQVAGAILEKEEGPVASFEFAALTLPSLADPSIAIAASRAGAIGVVDLSFLRGDGARATTAIATFARFGRGQWGIRLDPSDEGVASAVISSLPPTMGTAILVPAAADLLSRHADLLRARGARLLLEATSLDEARLAEELGFDGVIAKGHEAGGRVGETTTFVLLQQLRSRIGLPVWAQGGIGEHTAAACAVAGAAGVVLDSQLALTRESGLPASVKAEIARMDGSETSCVGLELGEGYRIFERAGRKAGPRLRELERTLAAQDPGPQRAAAWREGVADLVGWSSPDDAWLLGQDAAFAAGLARRFRTVGGVLNGLRDAVGEHLALASRLRPLAEGGPIARSHGTRYPIVQGPMTRVSDVAGFARDVAEAGALPFLALAVMRGPRVEELLRETQEALGDRPWGAGILGFVPLELREEQMEVLRRYPPSFALIAGGRPDQALSLEHEGIPTYLHVPSPGLLRLFTDAGARRFVLEGRECGGHVGPRTSFVLWNTMIDTLLDAVPPGDLPDCHVLFAGGIHDATSAAMVAAMAARAAEAGVKVGVLLGTAYLFTSAAVGAGAITPGFQGEAVRCTATVLLSSGPGHATRCADTPFAEVFRSEQRRLSREDLPADEVRVRLEMLNLGRLRIASKGVTRNPARERDPGAPAFVTLSASEQADQGMYMLGQVAALRGGVVTLAELHHDVSVRGAGMLDRSTGEERPPRRTARNGQLTPIAIVGMSCLLPKASSLEAYWQNILDKVDAIVEIPADRWDWRPYFDADPLTPDKIYSRWGGFVDKIPFDPVRYGMPPTTLPSIEPLQMLILEAVRAGLDDAGYLDRPFPRQHTGVILGVGGAGDLASRYGLRAALPAVPTGIGDELLDSLPDWTEDSFPGILLNVAAGRVANRFDLGGVNYTVDAACASSLAAVYLAARELEAGTADMMIVGGADASQTPFGYLCFSRTYALSPRGRCRAFDASADGIAISEGFGVVVLKRLADAERDGDHIYAVLKGIGGSSDGRDKSLTAPRPEGQALAVERAYAEAGFSPTTVGLIEAHGTGTVAGDRAELTTLTKVFGAAGAPAQGCAIGSVKSMIGHTKGTAGVAGLIKVALGMDRKVLPPTMHVERPNPAAGNGDGPFYLNTEARPWLRPPGAPPRRAGVSAFGFGGTNFHVAVEEYTGDDYLPGVARAPVQGWPSELLCWSAASREELRERLQALGRALGGAREEPPLREVASAVWAEATSRSGQPVRLAVVASTAEDLRSKLAKVSEALASPSSERHDPDASTASRPSSPAPAGGPGVYWTDHPLAGPGTIAFLYPGQGSQHPDMLRDLAISFAEAREPFELADAVLAGRFERPLSSYVFAPPGFSPEGQQARVEALKPTDRAQPALGAAGMGLSRLLASLGVRPALVAGHSYGEYVALCSAGVIAEDVLYRLSEARGRCIVESAGADLGTMAAVPEPAGRVAEVLGSLEDVWVANLNAPRQTVISGTRRGIQRAVELLAAAGIGATPLTVACGFHSPLVAPARERLARVLDTVTLEPPRLPVYSNTEARRYPAEPERIARLLADHLVQPVRFAEQIDQMYADGARVFVETGPGGVLTGLVGQVLGTRPHLALRAQGSGHGVTALQHALAQLHAHGVDLDLDRLYRGRVTGQLRLDALDRDPAPLPKTTWLVDPASAQPLNGRATAVKRPTAPPQGPSTNGTAEVALPALPAQAGDGNAHMVLAFQQLMSKFLDTQQEVMTAYLTGAANGSANGSGNGVANGPANGHAPVADEPVPPPAVEPAPPPALPEDGPVDAERVTRELIRVVAERTGYPPEMLDLDVDMEADLGIDSIKKVEILGVAQQELGTSAPAEVGPDALGGEAMETLARARTLRALVEAIVALAAQYDGHGELPPAEATPPQADEPEAAAEPEAPAGDLPRFTATVVAAPREATEQPLRVDGIVAITDDERGVARDLAALLSNQGIEVALIRDHHLPAEGSDGYAARLGDAQAARDLVEAIHRRQGPIACLVHLLPLRAGLPFDELDIRGWQARLDLETRSLFHLAQAASADLRRGTTRTCLLAAVQLDGAFGFHGDGAPFQPSHGGVAGLVKTLAREWPEVGCKVVDLGQDLGQDCSAAAERLAAELLPASDPEASDVEVGWSAGQRTSIQLVPAPLPPTMPPLDARISQGRYRGGADERALGTSPLQTKGKIQPGIDADSILLITGGARGITATVACEIARRYQPTIILLGRSGMPEPDEDGDTAGITDPRALKIALAARLESAGSPATPARVEPAYRRLLADREMRANLLAMTEAGAHVHYHQVDVRDAEQLTQLIDDVYAWHGRIDGVIHGAGIIQDKLVEDKTTDSFDQVLDTKTLSAFTLARALRPDSLEFLVFFSSVSARLGNRGQGDYAAANEVLNKLAVWLDARWPGRVTSLLWGPWRSGGMVSAELERQFSRHGVQVIPPRLGAAALIDELNRGTKGDVEVVLGAGPWQQAARARQVEGLPLLAGERIVPTPDGIAVTRLLDPDRDRYLRDHQLDGRPVLPAAVAMELVAEAAAAALPGLHVAELRDTQVLKGVILKGGTRPVTVQTAAARPKEGGTAVDVTIVDQETERVAYRAEVILQAALPAAPDRSDRPPIALEPFPMTVERAYRELLFHGPLMRGITRVEGIDGERIVALLAPSSPRDCLAGAGDAARWLVDPVLVDSGFQLAILWARTTLGMTPLPGRLGSYRRFAPVPGPAAGAAEEGPDAVDASGPVRCELRARLRPGGNILDAQLEFSDAEGRLIALIEGMEAPCSRSLNRLATPVAADDAQ